MAESPFAGVQACVFDAYGTLFDYASAAAKCSDVLGDKAATLTQLWRDKQVAYTWLRAAQGRHADFWQVTGEALDYAMESLNIDNPALRDRLMKLYLQLDVFSDVRETLAELKRAGQRLAILSNGSHDMLKAAILHAKIGPLFDAVLSVDEVAVFKPHPKVYRLALDRLNLTADQIVFVSSNGWDAYAASAFGMRTAWCNRYGQRPERLPGQPDCMISSLAVLPGLIGA